MSNPFDSYFTNANVNIRQGSDKESVNLSISFLPENSTVSLHVLDRNVMEYTHYLNSADENAVNDFFRDVEQDYSTVILDSVKDRVKQYLVLLPQSFTLNAESEPEDCELCGGNDNTITGFYFPAVNDEVPATIVVHWTVGCFGGEHVSDEFTAGKANAVENVADYLNFAIEKEGAYSSNAVAAAAFLTKIIAL